MGATQASAGILAPYVESRDDGPLLELTTRSLGLFDGFIERVSSASGISVPYERTGTLDVATDDAEMRHLVEIAEHLSSRGVITRLLDARAARLEEPQLADRVVGGL